MRISDWSSDVCSSDLTYLCSVRTMYRLLTSVGENRERRDQRAPVHHAAPRLSATAPDQVWTWDITKLVTLTTGVFLNQTGSASCRERVCQYVKVPVVPVSLKKKR